MIQQIPEQQQQCDCRGKEGEIGITGQRGFPGRAGLPGLRGDKGSPGERGQDAPSSWTIGRNGEIAGNPGAYFYSSFLAENRVNSRSHF